MSDCLSNMEMNPNQDLYTAYREEQFAADEYFQQWVLHPDEDNTLFWEAWLHTYPEKREVIERASILVQELAANDYSVQPLTPFERSAIRNGIFRQLDLPDAGSSTPSGLTIIPKRRNQRMVWMAAAGLIVAVVTTGLLLNTRTPAGAKTQDQGLITITAGASDTKRVILEDSTIVILNAGSTLQYRNGDNTVHPREAWLTGNAYFTVRKNNQFTPFLIHARSLAITVLGTELNVNARTGSAAITLTSGRIKVQQQGTSNPTTYLIPGDRISLDTSTHTLVGSRIDTDLYAAWSEGKWNFRKTSLGDITSLLQEYYGVEVRFRNERSKRMRIDALMPVSSLEKLITVIEHTLQIKITLINHQLIVN